MSGHYACPKLTDKSLVPQIFQFLIHYQTVSGHLTKNVVK